MTELPDLPPPPDRDRPLPPGGLERAVSAGRRRRHRFVGGAAGGTLALVVAGALLLSGGPTTDALIANNPEPTPMATATPTAAASGDPQPSAGASADPAEPASGASSDPQPSSSPGAGRPGQPEFTEPPEPPEPDEANQPGGRPAPDDRDPFTEQPGEGSAAMCGVSSDPVKAPNYGSVSACSTSSGGASQVRQGGQVSATYGICVATGGDPLPLRFDSGREHEVRVYQGGRVVYQFSQTVRYPEGPHTRTVPSGRCLLWTGTWDTTLADGSDAPPGGYRVRVSVEPDAVNGFETHDGDHGYLEYDVTVTA